MSTTSLKELLAQKAELDRLIAETQRAEREQAIAQVRSLMSEYGLTLADIGGHARAAPRAAGRAGTARVEPKYRHPDTGETWAGRGLKPRWLRDALAAGRTLAEFEI